jgi:hypothetical protein
MSQNDHAARLREMAAYASWIAMSYSETAPHVSVKYERNSVALTAGAEALERVAVLERELAEARKQNEANLDRMDKAILEAQRGEKKAIATVEQLRVELAEARKDVARLDWVIRNFEEVNFDGWFDYADTEALDANEENETLAAWRKYIDVAMEEN